MSKRERSESASKGPSSAAASEALGGKPPLKKKKKRLPASTEVEGKGRAVSSEPPAPSSSAPAGSEAGEGRAVPSEPPAPSSSAPTGGPLVQPAGTSGQHDLVLSHVPRGTTAKSLRSFFAAAGPVNVEVKADGSSAVIRLKSQASARKCAAKWQACEAALGSGSGTGRASHTFTRSNKRPGEPWAADAPIAAAQRPDRGPPGAAAPSVAVGPLENWRGGVPMSGRPSVDIDDAADVSWPKTKCPTKDASAASDWASDWAPDPKAAARQRIRMLTQQVADFAKKRQLPGAIAAFQRLQDEGLALSVHAWANLINAHVNSGDMEGASRTFADMRSAGFKSNVVVYTTLLKGHSRLGDIVSACALLEEMASHDPPILPDIRCLNTVLRGCVRVGDVAAARNIFKRMDSWKVVSDGVATRFFGALFCQDLDLSSLKALISQNAGTAPATKPRAAAAAAASEGAEGQEGEKEAATAAPCKFWAKGRCNGGDRCKFFHDPSLVQERHWRASLERSDADAALNLELARSAALLGKRKLCRLALKRARKALKASEARVAEAGSAEQAQQKAIHLEQSLDLEYLDRFATGDSSPDLTRCMARTLLFGSTLVSGQDTALAGRKRTGSLIVDELANTFGLGRLIRLGRTSREGMLQQLTGCLSVQGRILWHKVFGSARDVPVKLEICAGSGEWAVAQARAEGSAANWAVLEIMRDRTHRAFSRMALEGVGNLCIIGGDAAQVLHRHVVAGSVDHIFINFPEPPHTSGDEAAESQLHLLTAPFFCEMQRALCPTGRITILSDNGRYFRTLAATVAALRDDSGAMLFSTVPQGRMADTEDIDGIEVICGRPGPANGHTEEVTSYFDGLWHKGSRTDRYFLALRRT